MKRNPYFRLLRLVLLTLMLLAAASPAFATKPEFTTISIDEMTEFGECDGFAVIEHLEGTIKVSLHFDQAGTPVMEINRIRLRHTFTNSETGASLFTPDVGVDKVEFSQGEPATVAVIGLVGRFVVPGEGLVFAHMGIIVFDLNTGEVLHVGGPHDDFEDLLPVLCSALD